MTAPDLEPTLRFLSELKQNNERPWFEAHRRDYERACSGFEDLMDDVIDVFRESDRLQALRAKSCTARIYRDVRFSKDKSPYKTNLAAQIAPNGWHSEASGYYISIEPGGQSLAGAGLYSPTPRQLEAFRETIAHDSSRFKTICSDPEFVAVFGAVAGERLKTAPKGYERDHPEIALLQLKQIVILRHFSDEEVLAPVFLDEVIRACRAMRPFIDYIQDITA
jgi:uncharacterized protein (TIGR02453 family)